MPPTGSPFATWKQRLLAGSAHMRGSSSGGGDGTTRRTAGSSGSRAHAGSACQARRASARPGPGCASASRGRAADIEAEEDLRQKNLCAVLIGHAVSRDEHDGRRRGLLDDLADRRIDRLVDPEQRVADRRRELPVVPRMPGVVEMPALVARAMSLREDLDEEIPAAPREQRSREAALDRRSAHEAVDERLVVPSRATGTVAGSRLRMESERRDDLVPQTGRRRLEAVHAVVGAPLDDLDPVQIGRKAAQRHIEHCDVPSGPARRRPEWLAALGTVGDPLVGVASRPELSEVVDPVARGPDPRRERRPRRADEEALDATRSRDGAGVEQRRDRRQPALARPPLEQPGARGVDSEHEDALPVRHLRHGPSATPAAGRREAAASRRGR